jgi:small nuclear ribonucleoprotein (snRNP)-like protein
VSGFEDLINKKVVVTKSDGYVKYGILKKIDAIVLVLIFDDGKEAYIPMVNVASVSLDTNGSGGHE